MLKAEILATLIYPIFISYLVCPASKSLMTIKHCCFWYADLVSYSSFYTSSNICSLKKPHHFLHFINLSRQCPYVTLDIYLFLLSFHWDQLFYNVHSILPYAPSTSKKETKQYTFQTFQ